MKHAMKKLLSLMLVAVLLVSVVPFASAITFENNYVAFKYLDKDGNEISTYRGTEPQNGEMTDDAIAGAASMFMPSGYDFVSVDAMNPDVFGDTVTYTVTVQRHIEEMVALVIELVVKGGDTVQYNVGEVKAADAATTMSKADALLKLAGKGSEYEITSSEASLTPSSTKYVYSFSAEKKTAGKVTLTVKLSTGGSVAISVEPGTEVKKDTIKEAIAKQLGTNDFTFTLTPKAPFTVNENMEVTANITKNNTSDNNNTGAKKVNLTVTLKGDAAGSVTLTVNAGTEVKKDTIRDAIVNALGRSNFTFKLNPQAPITVNQNMDVTATVTNDSNNNNNPSSNVTLTMVVSGAYSGTAKLSVASGTTVSPATMKDAIKSQLGIGSSFTIDRENSITVNGNTTIYITTAKGTDNKFPYKVYLHVYLNNNIGEPDRNINITNTLAVDGVVSMSEVKNLIPDYYKAKTSNGIGYDGLYLAKGNWVKDYVTDANKYEKLNDVDVRTGEEYVHINVMITNATAKTSSNADTSNPKTGDAIFMTITVMGLSAVALTGMFFYDKKRRAQ